MHDPRVVCELVASALVDVHFVKHPTAHVRQDNLMPGSMRRALSLLSSLCLVEGRPDAFSSVHEFMAMATSPIGDWRLPSLAAPFDLADVVLVDGDQGVPTEDCLALSSNRRETEVLENFYHEQLRSALSGFMSPRKKDRVYRKIREFIARNPAVSISDLADIKRDPDLISISSAFDRFYRKIPIQAVRPDGSVYLCKHCGSVLWEDIDTRTYPDGRCRIRQCHTENPKGEIGRKIENPDTHVLARNEILSYWVGPGLDEIRMHDALKAAGIEVVLYPQEDAADVGTADRILGIDGKSYTSPVTLALKLTKSIGGLSSFKTKYVAVSDGLCARNPHYLKDARAYYQGKDKVVFDTVSGVISKVKKEFSP